MARKRIRVWADVILLLAPLSTMGTPQNRTFDDSLLHYHVDYVDSKAAAIVVSLRKAGDEECASAALSTAKQEIDKRWPLGHEIGKDDISVIPTSGKRRDTIKFDNAVVIMTVFSNPAGKCEIFDRATFFYWLRIRGKVSGLEARRFSLDSSDENVKQYLVSIGNKEFRVSREDFEKLREGETVELEYLLQQGLPARLNPATTKQVSSQPH